MKSMKKTLCWLVVAAALSFSACSSEDSVIEEKPTTQQPAQTATKIHVTVGAGIGEGDAAASSEDTSAGEATTRADVTVATEGSSKTRTLTFTKGDRLYVYGSIYVGEKYYILAGYLDIDQSSIGSDATTAQFSGDLKTYDNEGQEMTYAFTTDDPLAEFDCSAYLVPKDAVEGLYKIDKNFSSSFNYAKSIVSTTSSGKDIVSELMKKALYVMGEYNATSRSFTLEKQNPILNFDISGLAMSNTKYNVRLVASKDETKFNEGNYNICDLTFDQTIESNSSGHVRFAISIEKFKNYYRGIYISNSSGRCFIPLGRMQLEKKVYNVTRTLPYGQRGTLAGIENQFGFNDATVGNQSDYGLVELTVKLVDASGNEVTDPISDVRIRLNNELYTLTAENWPTSGFASGDLLYAAMKDGTEGEVIITAYTGISKKTLYRGVTYLSIDGGTTTDLGTLTLRPGICVTNSNNYSYVAPDASGNYSLGSDCNHIVYGKGNASIEAQSGDIDFADGTELTGNLNFWSFGSYDTELYLEGDVTVNGNLTGNGIDGYHTRIWKRDNYVSNVKLTVNGNIDGRIIVEKGVTLRVGSSYTVNTSSDNLGIFDSAGNRITPVRHYDDDGISYNDYVGD